MHCTVHLQFYIPCKVFLRVQGLDLANSFLICENKTHKNQFNTVPEWHMVEFVKLKSMNWKFSRFCEI